LACEPFPNTLIYLALPRDMLRPTGDHERSGHAQYEPSGARLASGGIAAGELRVELGAAGGEEREG